MGLGMKIRKMRRECLILQSNGFRIFYRINGINPVGNCEPLSSKCRFLLTCSSEIVKISSFLKRDLSTVHAHHVRYKSQYIIKAMGLLHLQTTRANDWREHQANMSACLDTKHMFDEIIVVPFARIRFNINKCHIINMR